MTFKFNPLDKKYSSSGGSLRKGNALTVFVETSASACNLSLYNDYSGKVSVYPMKRVSGGFTVSLCSLEVGLYYYCFVVDGDIFGEGDMLNATQYPSFEMAKKYQLTVYKRNYTTPSWLKGGVIYQIFPDRFCRGEGNVKLKPKMKIWGDLPNYLPNKYGKILNDDFFGGNFKGIESKLNYLKELGVTAIYLNPVSKAFSNHRYDTADYLSFDELLGTESDFKSLITSAENLGISIIYDGVYNHTGDDSVYFNKYGNFDSVGAYNSKSSKYYSWYNFENYPDKYNCWWGINVLPTINKQSTEFEDFITEQVIDKYLSLGVKGVRLDVVDELPERFTIKIRKAVKKRRSDAVIIGEVWEDASNKIAYGVRRKYFQGGELDSVMNYPLKNAIISYALTGNEKELVSVVLTQLNNYPAPARNLLMNILSTHDTARILTVLSGKEIPENRVDQAKFTISDSERSLAVLRLKISAVLLYTLYGVPTIYYGDEIGLEGCKDPFNRTCMTFSGGNQEILSLYKKLGNIRKNPAFINGTTEILFAENGAFAFRRISGKHKVTVAVNLGNYRYNISLEKPQTDYLSGKKDTIFNLDKNSFFIIGDDYER